MSVYEKPALIEADHKQLDAVAKGALQTIPLPWEYIDYFLSYKCTLCQLITYLGEIWQL